MKVVTTIKCHPQSNEKVGRYNCTLVARLYHCFDKRQKDWDFFFQPLTCAYNSQVHWTKRITPFSLTPSREPSGTSTMTGYSGASEEFDRMTPSKVKLKLMDRLLVFLRRTEAKSNQARCVYQKCIVKMGKNLKTFKPED